MLRRGRFHLDISPFLTFESRSPDRCWTVFAPRSDRESPRRTLDAVRLGQGEAWLRFNDGELTTLTERVQLDDGQINIDASSVLSAPVYSHLNTLSSLTVYGHRRLTVSFSPCPDVRVEVTNSDYPFGRPLRLAYLDGHETLHVVESSSGEKGPFHELASGALPRSAPLTVTLFDERLAFCRITFLDWAYQAGTELSPTAGWGLPVNSIEFSLAGDAPASVASIWITLAGTGVGRGWDSVGHTAGTYRNRIAVEWLR
jgi:hypothetical protein